MTHNYANGLFTSRLPCQACKYPSRVGQNYPMLSFAITGNLVVDEENSTRQGYSNILNEVWRLLVSPDTVKSFPAVDSCTVDIEIYDGS